MKVAWVTTSGPEALGNAALARLEIIADTYLSLNSPIQWAFEVLLEQKRSLKPQILERVRQNWADLQSTFSERAACELLEAEGGWYAVLRTHSDQPDEELAIQLLRRTHTLAHPGHFYDFCDDGYLVVSLITPRGDFRRGIDCLREFLTSVGG
jgi:aspartate/methionine/tyrosine aminotransferase